MGLEALHPSAPLIDTDILGRLYPTRRPKMLRLKIGHCAFMHKLRYGPAMTCNAISAVYYYPDEVGIG